MDRGFVVLAMHMPWLSTSMVCGGLPWTPSPDRCGQTHYISTFWFYFLISFITFFFPKAFYLRVKKKNVHNSVVPAPADGAHTRVEFLNACIKCFGKKDVWYVMNEIKK